MSLLTNLRLSKIPQRNKHLTYGYVRQHMSTLNCPQIINVLCLLYVNDNVDKVSTDTKCKFKGNIIQSKGNPEVIYFENKVAKGIHAWTFKVTDTSKNSTPNFNNKIIGILGIETIFQGITESISWIINSMIAIQTLRFESKLENNDKVVDLKKYKLSTKIDNYKIQCGDIIEMNYNIIAKTLLYKINQEPYLKINIEKYVKPTLYRAKLTLIEGVKSCQYELVSYQKTY